MIPLKSIEEIRKIEIACKITAEILTRIGEYIQEGISTKELDQLIEGWIKMQNAYPAFLGYRGFPANTCISIDEEVVHGIPGPRQIKKGELVKIDVGVMKDGFYGDAAVTFPVEPISAEKRKLMETTKASLGAGIAQARKGNRISHISVAIQTTVEADGFQPVRALVGHGVGKAVHEEPQIPNFSSSGKSPKIENGMVLAIEPMINAGTFEVYTDSDGWTVQTEDGKPSAHFEHTVAVVDGMPKILTAV